MARHVWFSKEAEDDYRAFADPLPGRHQPPNLDDLDIDLGFIVEVLATSWQPGDPCASYEPFTADLITAAPRLEPDGSVLVTALDFWPKGTYRDEAEEGG